MSTFLPSHIARVQEVSARSRPRFASTWTRRSYPVPSSCPIPSHHSTLGEVSIASSSTASLHLSRVNSTSQSWLLLTDTTTRPRPRTPRLISPVDASAQALWLLDFGFSFGFFWGIYWSSALSFLALQSFTVWTSRFAHLHFLSSSPHLLQDRNNNNIC